MNIITIISACLVIAVAVAVIIFLIIKQKKSDDLLQNKTREYYENTLSREILNEKNRKLNDEISNIKQELTQLREKHEALISKKSELESSQQEKNEQIEYLKFNIEILTNKLEAEKNNISMLQADLREKQAILDAEKEKLAETKHNFETQKSTLKAEFKLLSTEIIKEHKSELQERNKEGITTILNPLQEQISNFNRRINDVHETSIRANTKLESEIKKVCEIGIRMSTEADNLVSALKGDSQMRGAWGEALLERTLQISGLIEDEHYAKQSSFKDIDGKRKQTDYLIKLPDNKNIIIDSKVSLNAYDLSVSLNTEEERQAAMNEHINSVRKHINDLASKEYTNIYGIESPDFVLMFMPVEPAYIEALKNDKGLFEYGYAKNVILVSHTTLIPILRTVSNLWILDKSSKEARAICDKAGDIYNSVCTVTERLVKLGGTLDTAGKQYNSVTTALGGLQGLHGKVEKLKTISTKASKIMPEIRQSQIECNFSLLEVKPIDIDNEDN